VKLETMPDHVKAEINCDCGESFGNWVLGPSLISFANPLGPSKS
jgi:hypothetical protein